MESSIKTNRLVMTALMMCLVLVTTMFFKVPIPFANGYVHMGDTMIFLSVLILGWRYGALAAAFGSALGDVLGGYAIWAPWTFFIKGGMAILMGWLIVFGLKRGTSKSLLGVPVLQFIGMILAGILMIVGYYIAEGFIYGNWLAPMLGVPWNLGQFTTGMIVAGVVAAALYKTPAGKFFAYPPPARKAETEGTQ